MTELIQPDDTNVLAAMFNQIKKQAYIDAALELQQQLEHGILSGEVQAADTSTFNHFAPDVYLRQFNAKAGTLVVSKMHRTEHFIVFLTGSLTVATDDGLEYIQAPVVTKTMPGTKRIAYFHEDSICLTIHPTKLTNVDEIEKQIIVPVCETTAFLASLGRSREEFSR